MSVHVIANPVPTAEEMAEILGLPSERVAAVRRIMNSPRQKTSERQVASFKASSLKKKSGRNRSRSAKR